MKIRRSVCVLTIFWLGTHLLSSFVEAQSLHKLPNCRFIPTEWADGDSFLVADESGKEMTIRLYAVDCLEARITDDSDATRLRGQRRYFGMSKYGGSPQSSIEAAKNYGNQAAAFVAHQLNEPFTLHTAFADARGDGKHKRFYGFVTCRDGEDLGEKLVQAGLARAFGVYRETPDGRSRDEYREWMKDIELLAAKKGVGIWSVTDWDSLLQERKQDRDEIAELQLAKIEILPEGFSLNPNTAPKDDLLRLPGIGEIIANRIIENRPYSSIEALSSVQGIGEKKLLKLKPFLTLD